MVKQPEFNTGGRGSSGKSLFRTISSGEHFRLSIMCSLPGTEFVATRISFKKDYWCGNCPFFHVCSKRRLWTGWKMLRVN